MKNLNDNSMNYVLQELSERNFYDDRISYLMTLEDEVEELKILLEDWQKGFDKECEKYGNDLITSGGIGNLIML